MTDLFPNFPTDKYEIIYIDPPWDYKNQVQTGKNKQSTGGAETHYPCLKLAQLKTMPIRSIMAPNCLVFMWTSSPHFPQAIELMTSFGFKWATVGFVWYKEKPNPGFYTMSETEMCIEGFQQDEEDDDCFFVLTGKSGTIPKPRGTRNERQFLSERRTKHSTKPEEIAARIERMFPNQSKIELFARKPRPGWAVYGNQIQTPDEMTIP